MKARAASRILVIDANRDVMGYYWRLLETLGYGVETSSWESTSQGEIEQPHPDLVLFDVLVDATQEKQAWQLIRQIKASSFSAALPLLICAAAFVSPSFEAYLHDALHQTSAECGAGSVISGIMQSPLTHRVS